MAEESKAQVSNPPPSPPPKSSQENPRKSQVPTFPRFSASPNGAIQMYPIMYPALVPGLILVQNQERTNHGAGIYAVPVLPSMGPMSGLPSNTLIPLTYNLPTRTATPEGGAVNEEQGQEGLQQHAPHRQVERRFQFAFQIDLLLILKLAAVIFVFNQDGSRQRLILLVFFALLVYLYQTGALMPLTRRPVAPPQPRPVRDENGPAPVREQDENVALAEVQPGDENEIQPQDNVNQHVENENQPEPGARDGINWWGIAKEIQMIVVGFITSLLPGFHNID